MCLCVYMCICVCVCGSIQIPFCVCMCMQRTAHKLATAIAGTFAKTAAQYLEPSHDVQLHYFAGLACHSFEQGTRAFQWDGFVCFQSKALLQRW